MILLSLIASVVLTNQNIVADNMVCENESALLVVNYSQTEHWKRTVDYYISVQQLYALMQEQNSLFLVDTRIRSDYDSFRIKNSYNFQRESVLARPQLKNKHIVLINNGVNYKKTEILLVKMREAGFKEIQILDGGIPYWRVKMDRGGGVILQDNQLHFDALFNEDLTDWRIFNFSNEVFDISGYAKNVSIINTKVDINPAHFKQVVSDSTSLVRNVLLIAAKDSYNQLYKEWQSKLDTNIFIMSTEGFKAGLNKKDLEKRVYRYKQRTDGARFACE